MCVPRRPDSSGKCVYYMNRCNQRWFNQPLFGLTSRLASQAACRPLSLSSYFLSFFFFLPSPQNRMPVQPTLPWRQLQIQHPQPKMRSGTVSSRSVFLSQTSSSCSPFLSAFSFLFYSGVLVLSPLAVSPYSLLQLRLLLLRPPPCNPILKAVLSEHQ